MQRTSPAVVLAALAMTTLTACSGGGSAGMPDTSQVDPTPAPAFDPIPDLRSAHYQETLDLPIDQHVQVASASAINTNGASQRVGSLSLVTDTDRRNGTHYETDTVELAVAWEGSDSQKDYISVPVGDDFFKDGSTKVRESYDNFGNRILIVEHKEKGRRLYLPYEGAGVFAGAFSTNNDDEDLVAHAVFGRETLADELASQKRSARFQGWSEASIIASSTAEGNPNYSGSYSGTSGGSVDFRTGEFHLAATLKRNARSRRQIGIEALGVMTADGEMTASDAGFYNVLRGGKQFEGDFEGQMFGPEADNIGATFSGNFAGDDQAASISGQMLLSRQR